MSGYNNSLRYYKTYYEEINWAAPIYDRENAAVFKKQNQLMLAAQFPAEETHPLQYPAHLSGFELETTYPGLVIGGGITHGSGLLGELKLGFSLDYTSGLPVIAGSSIKGVLRSAFPLGYVYAAHNEKADLARNYIQYHLNKVQADQDWNKQVIDELDAFLFGSYESEKPPVSMSGRVVFHDAFPLNANRVKLNDHYTQTYLGDDYITPHKNRRKNDVPDAMVNPVPISFLKVLPGVLFRFQFELYDFRKEKDTLLSKAQLAQLFQNLLLELGVGAKTKVGYGQFALPSPDPGSSASTIGSTTQKMNPSSVKYSFAVGQEVEAYISRVNWAENKLELRVDGNWGTIAPMQVAKNVLSDLAEQRKIKVWVRAVNDDGSIKFLGNTPPKSTT